MVQQVRALKKRSPAQLPIERYVDYFVSSKLAEGCSPRYGDWLRDKIGLFVRWLERDGGSTLLYELSPDNVRRFIIAEQSRPRWENHPWRKSDKGLVSPSTIRGAVRALRIFGKWLAEERFTSEDVLASVKVPRAQQRELSPLVGLPSARFRDRSLSCIRYSATLASTPCRGRR